MDFPLFHLDWLNDRFLIAMIAIIHVLINHGLAVGFIPLVTWLEQKGVKNSGSTEITDFSWDKMAYKMMKVGFIITTTLGAMTGVGIWFSVALVSPASIGSLIRVFYWAWFTEWLVFVTEVILIVIYFLTWNNANRSLTSKLRHVRFGWFLSIFSWITMAIIVSILSFMMDPGNWNTHHSLLNGFTNPIYLPQLMFRTPTAMLIGGVFGLMLITLFTETGTALRNKAVRAASAWIICWAPFSLAGAINYYRVMPAAMKANMSTAIGTIDFSQYYTLLQYVILIAITVVIVLAIMGLLKSGWMRFPFALVACIIAFGFLGIFERVREFIRKPYVIAGYMYSNLLREEDYPLYKKDGILKYATYTSTPQVTADNKIEAGRNVFMLACSRCHTTQGVNSITFVFERMYGFGKPLDENSMAAYIPTMHNARTYMPPFPGNKQELKALVAYIKYVQETREVLEGAQTEGVTVNKLNDMEAAKTVLEKQQEEKALEKKLADQH